MKTEEALPLLRAYLRDFYTPQEWENISVIPTLASEVGHACAAAHHDQCSFHFLEVQREARRLLQTAKDAGVVH